MTKKLFAALLLVLLTGQFMFAQNEQTPYTGTEDAKPVVFRDRLIMDIYHSFWMGMPTQVEHMKFDPGFNVSALWDFKIKEKPLAIGLGVGISYYTQYSNALLQYDETSEIMKYYVLPSSVDYNRLKLNYLNVNIPVEFRYRHSNGLKVSVGARVGLVCSVSQKYLGDDPSNPRGTLRMKSLRMENTRKYHVDVYTRIGWKFIDLYYSLQVTPLFEAGKGPKIYPMSVGFSLSLF